MGNFFDGIKAILVSRVAQLAAKGVGYGVGVVLAYLHVTGQNDAVNSVAGAVAALAGIVVAGLWDLGVHYVQHGSVVTHTQDGPGAAEQDRQIEKAMPIIPLALLCTLPFLGGCTTQQQAEFNAKLQTIQQDIKIGSAIAAQVMPAASAIVTAVAPNTSTDKALQKANVQVQHIDGVVQKITITLPVTPAPKAEVIPPP